MVRIVLSSTGLEHIPPNSNGVNFTFHVTGSDYCCPSFVADFLSPCVSRIHFSDQTVQDFWIKTEDASSIFADILSLGLGDAIEFPSSSLSIASFISAELGNHELSNLLLNEIELSCDTAFDRLQILKTLDAPYDLEIEFISTHFSKFSRVDFDRCTFSDIYRLISHPHISLDSEDALYQFIRERLQTDSIYFSLFPFVHFEYLSSDSISDFLTLLLQDRLERFDLPVWQSLSNRFILPISDPIPADRHSMTFPFTPQAPLDGIIAHLTRQCGLNVVDAGVVSITASRALGDRPDLTAKNVADLTTTTYFWSVSEPNSWICWDFHALRVQPTAYSIRSYYRPSGGAHLTNWVFEGSANGVTDWVELDRRENNSELNEDHLATFTVSKQFEGKALRVRQIRPNHNGNFCLLLAAFEVFGGLRLVGE
jgi:hypothetical protein